MMTASFDSREQYWDYIDKKIDKLIGVIQDSQFFVKIDTRELGLLIYDAVQDRDQIIFRALVEGLPSRMVHPPLLVAMFNDIVKGYPN